AKQDIKKTATGYVSDSECNVAGISTTSHAEISGDFNSAYTVKTSSHAQGRAAGAAGRDTTMQLEAKWLGACKPDQKPGDIVMPRPVPPSSWLRALSSRRNGLNTSSRKWAGMPGPSSSTVTVK